MCDHEVMTCLLAGTSDGEQYGALDDGFKIVRQALIQRQDSAGRELCKLIRHVHP